MAFGADESQRLCRGVTNIGFYFGLRSGRMKVMRPQKIEIPPSGTARTKKNVTIQGIVRQREAVPIAPIRASII